MNIFKRYNFNKILSGILWVIVGCGTVVLLVAGITKKNTTRCKGLAINITGASSHFFIDKDEVQQIIVSYSDKNITGLPIEEFELTAIEAELKREVWVKNAELFFDNNEILQAVVEEREPVARIFTRGGNSFYVDNSSMILPLSEKLSARLPVFTGFPSDSMILSKADSSLLNDIKKLSMYIQQDTFLMAMIEQVDITPQRSFEMIPKIGEQVILFGNAADAEQKFKKLELFYKQVITKYGWSRYSVINLQYNGQVVAKIKGADDVSADSLRTVQIMHAIAENAARQASDSIQTIMQDSEKNTTDFSIISQSMERDETDEPSYTFEKLIPQERIAAPVKMMGNADEKPVTPALKKPVTKVKKPRPGPVVTRIKPRVEKPVDKAKAEKPKAEKPENEY